MAWVVGGPPQVHTLKNVQCTGSVFQSPRNLFHLGSQSHLKAFNLASPRWRRWRKWYFWPAERRHTQHCVLRFHQLCDNAGAAACSRKQLSMSKPMCFILQATGFYCSKFGVALSSQHIDGTRNFWAFALAYGVNLICMTCFKLHGRIWRREHANKGTP